MKRNEGNRFFLVNSRVFFLFLLGAAAAASGATITVTGNGDTIAVDGLVTLREAIASINAGANINADVVAVGAYGTSDTINFSIGTGVQTIAVTGSQLPAITKPVVINGTTQPGFAGTPLIVLDGVGLVGVVNGLTVSGGSSTVRGLVIDRFGSGGGAGIELRTNGGNTVAGNYIGINAAGTAASGNGNGVQIILSSNGNIIGGTTVADRNVISGNGDGVFISLPSGTIIEGNYIGTNAAGTAAVANGFGIEVFAPNTTIGGTTGTTPGGPCTGACNLISGNIAFGVELDSISSGTQVLGNLIGTNAAGTGPLGNAADGISSISSNNLIGGVTAAARNVIAFNGATGITIRPNFPDVIGNAILGNSIFGNFRIGIDLGESDGVTPNDTGDADTGANNLQNFPVISSVSIVAGNVTIGGSLNSTAATQFRVEFFSNASCNAASPSDFGEGQTFLGFVNVTTNGSGDAAFNPTFPIPGGQTVITATATDPNNNTSEFSQCFPSGVVTATPTLTSTATPTSTRTTTPTTTPTLAVPTATATPTQPAPTATRTSAPVPVAVAVPTASTGALVLLGLVLAAAALFLVRRS